MADRISLALSRGQRTQLKKLIATRSASAGHVTRARIVLLSEGGISGREISSLLSVTERQVTRVRRRFAEHGVAGLADRQKPGRQDHAVGSADVERLIQMALSPPPPGRSRWTSRLLGRALSLANSTVARLLKQNELKPHLSRTYKVSRDPDFVAKVEDVVGLYLQPPRNALVLSVDEKTGIQALQRSQLPLPLRKGRAATHTHDYKRHGVIDLFAALNVRTGKVTHTCSDSHTGADFLAFMKKVAKNNPRKQLHVIVDNSSTHSTPDVQTWLAKNSRVHFHYTPTSASWLNQVEGFFGILGKQSLGVTNFMSKAALRKHIDDFMLSWNDNPTPFSWTKPAAAIIKSRKKMLDRISKTVH
jgi:transposase